MLPRILRTIASLFAACGLAFPVSFAYDTELDSQSVRDAYFLGQRNDEKMARFLDAYIRHLSLPEKGPYVSEIQLLTPYAHVVEVSRARTVGYSAQQAEKEYRSRGDQISVRVRIEFTATYGGTEIQRPARGSKGEAQYTLRAEDFWKGFKIGLSQKDQWIEPLEQWGESIYSRGDVYGAGSMGGALVWLTFDAKDVASSEAAVEVFTPDGQHVAATFDLAKLR